MKKVWKIFSSLLTAVLIVLVASNLYIAAARSITGEKQPAVFGFSSAVVVSGSMQPQIAVNDMVITRRSAQYEVNDIIMFHSGNSVVTHRITQKTSQGYITKGDANNTEDSQIVTEENIVGKVILTIPHIGAVFEFTRTPLGMLCVIVFGMLILFWPSFADKLKSKKTGGKDIEE